MSTDPRHRLRLLDLNMLDARELQLLLPAGSFEIEAAEQPSRTAHGSIATEVAVVIIASVPAIQAIEAWLLKKRQRKTITLKVEKIGPDNSIERHTLKIDIAASQAPHPDVMKQIMEGMALDPATLTKIISEDQ